MSFYETCWTRKTLKTRMEEVDANSHQSNSVLSVFSASRSSAADHRGDMTLRRRSAALSPLRSRSRPSNRLRHRLAENRAAAEKLLGLLGVVLRAAEIDEIEIDPFDVRPPQVHPAQVGLANLLRMLVRGEVVEIVGVKAGARAVPRIRTADEAAPRAPHAEHGPAQVGISQIGPFPIDVRQAAAAKTRILQICPRHRSAGECRVRKVGALAVGPWQLDAVEHAAHQSRVGEDCLLKLGDSQVQPIEPSTAQIGCCEIRAVNHCLP